MINKNQLELFKSRSLNPVHEIKRQIRLILSNSTLSRDQIAEKMNLLASKEGMPGRVTKARLDSWCKDSDQSRIPSSSELVLFCYVMKNNGPLDALASPLFLNVIDYEDQKLLAWAKAEIEKKKAIKRARIALEEIE